jgi:hypothetical protein
LDKVRLQLFGRLEESLIVSFFPICRPHPLAEVGCPAKDTPEQAVGCI